VSGHLTLSRCWPCQFSDHFTPPQKHSWLDEEDAEHMDLPFLPDSPRAIDEYPCACECGGGPGAHLPLTDAIATAIAEALER
jgi:hypothetical protein